LFVKAGNRYDYLPMCRLVTNFLVTYPIIESAFQDLMTLPKELPNNHVEERLAKEQLILAQSFFLAMRGSYDPAGGEELAPMLRKVMSLGEKHYGKNLKGASAVRAAMA